MECANNEEKQVLIICLVLSYSTFDFAYAKSWISHDVAHFKIRYNEPLKVIVK